MAGPKPRLLIAGGGYADVPLILAAQRLGFHVITSGNRPEDIGHLYSDDTRLADFSDTHAILKLASELKIDAICPCCNDFSAISSAMVAEKLGLPGHDSLEVAELLHHKDRYRAFAQKLGIPTPKAFGCSSLDSVAEAAKKLNFPVVIKPVDLTGGKGITRVDKPEGVSGAVQIALSVSKLKRIVVEEFVIGSRHGFTALLRAGKVVFHCADNEHYHLSPYLVSGASVPTNCPDTTTVSLIEFSETIASELCLRDGVFHVQFIQPELGDPVIIEICRRAPGDLYIDLVRHSTGAPYAEWIVRASAGLGISDAKPMPVRHCVTRHCLMADSPGSFAGFDFDPEIENAIVDRMIWATMGEKVRDPSTHKFGIVFVKHQDQEHMQLQAPHLQKLLSVKMQSL